MESRQEHVLVLGANPAWQKTVTCPRLAPGEVVRVRLEASGAAGKGFNTAHAVRSFGIPVRLVSGAGDDVDDWERACREEGFQSATFPLRGPIRTATTVQDLSNGTVTEIVEEGCGAADGAEAVLESALGESRGSAVLAAVAGTFPPGMSPRGALGELSCLDVPVLVDSVPCLRALRDGAPRPNRAIFKLNESEWKGVLGEADLVAALRQARRLWPGVALIATRGKDGAWLLDQEGRSFSLWSEPFPPGVRVQPIGAGDAFSGGMLAALAEGESLVEAASRGMAVARASCLNPLPGRFSMEEVAVASGSTRVRAEAV